MRQLLAECRARRDTTLAGGQRWSRATRENIAPHDDGAESADDGENRRIWYWLSDELLLPTEANAHPTDGFEGAGSPR